MSSLAVFLSLNFLCRLDDGLNISYNLQNAARLTVPGGPSVACSTAKAAEWDAAWADNLDPSGRADLGVHASAYQEGNAAGADKVPGNGVATIFSHMQIKDITVAAREVVIKG